MSWSVTKKCIPLLRLSFRFGLSTPAAAFKTLKTTADHVNHVYSRKARRRKKAQPARFNQTYRQNSEAVTSVLSESLEYIRRLILGTAYEKGEVVRREQILHSGLPDHFLQLRGLVIGDMQVDFSHSPRTVGNRLEIQLVKKDGSGIQGAAGWRSGALVTLQFSPDGDFSHLEDWQQAGGILSHVGPGGHLIRLRLDQLQPFVLDAATGKHTDNTLAGFRLIKRSEGHIYDNYLQSLARMLEEPLNLEPNRPFGAVCLALFNSSPESLVEEGTEQRQQVVLFDKSLEEDKDKVRVLEMCGSCRPVSLIHGPPGTGKTTALAAAVLSAVANGEKVLVSAPSHAACDAFTMAIARQWPSSEPVRCLRLADKLRLTDRRVERYLPCLTEDALLPQLEMKLANCRAELLWAAGRGGCRGLETQLADEAALVQQLRVARQEAERSAIEASSVVVATLMTATQSAYIRRLLSSRDFGLVAVDEAGFTTDSNLLPLIALAPRLILAGDHCQLPPVLHTAEARQLGLHVSLFEQLVAKLPGDVTLLSVQYRSNGEISEWSSHYFYSSQLKPHPSVQHITLSDLSRHASALASMSVIFVDTQGNNWHETFEEDESYSNSCEALMVCELVEHYHRQLGISQHLIGVITPYWAQVALIRSLVWEGAGLERVEVRTVDGFQGREKELIILSLVRSNKVGEVGFLSETRRINVSVTRARRGCVIVGDGSTLASDPGLSSLLHHCTGKGFTWPAHELSRLLGAMA